MHTRDRVPACIGLEAIDVRARHEGDVLVAECRIS